MVHICIYLCRRLLSDPIVKTKYHHLIADSFVVVSTLHYNNPGIIHIFVLLIVNGWNHSHNNNFILQI